ncbi:hypothetical protein SDC9_157485 [bioreactor metagenome]|uniref:Uncharacterized protein n=1 Tax=bioreactor metagenome TaxID=1076179 RepID=A0A645F8F6_9ZZZZ
MILAALPYGLDACLGEFRFVLIRKASRSAVNDYVHLAVKFLYGPGDLYAGRLERRDALFWHIQRVTFPHGVLRLI